MPTRAAGGQFGHSVYSRSHAVEVRCLDAETIVVGGECIVDDLNQRGPVGRKARFRSHTNGRMQIGQQSMSIDRPEDDYVLIDSMNGSRFGPAGCWMNGVQCTGRACRRAEVAG